jgi:murein DD-endopeptidase MepM/ murein hydrolase activator NlpD
MFMRKLTRYLLATFLLGLQITTFAQGDYSQQDNLEPQATVPGGIYTWALPRGATNVRFEGRPVWVSEGRALIGIPLNQQLGMAQVQYQHDGKDLIHTFEVTDKAYTEQHITLSNPQMVNPNPAQLSRIREESQRQKALYLRFTEQSPTEEGFILPLAGRVSSLFGHRRFFNGQPRNPHSGLDIAAATGTPVVAPSSGQVILVDDLYYNGKTVFLDHGQGLITMYCHLSEQSVTEGVMVDQGQVIGLVGATGRVTGPHLHWSVSLNGYRVDPTTLLELMPSTNSN